MYCDICMMPLDSFPDAIKHHKDAHNATGYMTCNCGKKVVYLFKAIEHCVWHENPEAYK